MRKRTGRGRVLSALVATTVAFGSVAVVSSPAAAAGTVTITDHTDITEGVATVFNVNRTDPTNGETIEYTIGGDNPADVAVTAEGDGAIDGVLTFAPGQSDQTLTITAIDDLDGETGESFSITLSNSSDGSSLPGAETANILDDGDAGTLSFSAASQSTTETDSPTNLIATVTRTGGTEGQVQVTVSEASADLEISGGSSTILTFQPGDAQENASITVVGDNVIEALESPTVVLSAPTNGGVLGATTVHQVDITDDDGLVTFGTLSSTATEDDGSGSPNTVNVTISRAGTGESTTVTIGSSSTGDVLGDTIIIGAGALSGDATITIVGDDVAEAFESITLSIDSVDGNATTNESTSAVNVTDDDVAPVGGADGYAVDEDGSLDTSMASPGILDNDTDADSGDGPGNLTATQLTSPSNGSLGSFDGATGHFTYTPTPQFSGVDSFTYEVSDGTNVTGPITVTITVNGENDPPTAVDDAYDVDEDTVLDVDVANGVRNANDSDVEDALADLSISLDTGPLRGDLVLNADGSFAYTPDENFSGVDSFTYTLTDTGLLTASATVTITINDVNADPVAVDDTFFDVPSGTSSAYSVLFEGAPDSDQDGDPITITDWDAISAAGAAVSCAGGTICSYSPAGGFLGEDTFTYTISDGNGGFDVGLVTLFVGMPRDCDPFPRIGGTITGTSGDDVICGTAAADTILGGGGNDVILGLGGDDTLDGGDGSDAINGGGGTDTIVHNGTSGVDVIVASAGSAGDDTHGDIERVIVDGLGGGDTVVVTPSPDVAFEVNGGAGFDRLEYQKAGLTNVVDTGTRITADGVLDVEYSSFETVLTEGTGFFGGAGPDSPALGTAPIFINSPAGGLHIDLLGGSDQVEIEFGALAGVVEVVDSGASGDDTLKVYGQTGSGDVINLGDTSVTSSGQTITYADMEQVIIDGRGGDDTINVNLGSEVGAAAFPLPSFVLLQGGGGTDLAVLTYPQSCTIDEEASPVTISLSDGTVVTLDPTLEGADVTCAGVRSVVSSASGYWMARASGGIFAFGQVQTYGSAPAGAPLSALDNHPANVGHWAVEEDGTVHAFGLAQHFGDADEFTLNGKIVSLASSRTGDGYYLLGTDGGVFSYGDAAFHGSTGNIVLNQPVVSMAANPAGEGYWFVATDGGIFTFGPDTEFHGSVPFVLGPNVSLAQPIVGMTPTASGQGYWLVAADGGIFAFGDAVYYGSVPEALGPGVLPNEPIVGIVASPTGNGYWIVAADGGVFAFGDAFFWGSMGAGSTITDMIAFAG